MRPENWGRNITRTSLKLQNVKFSSLDFEGVLDNLPENDSIFLFIASLTLMLTKINFTLVRLQKKII